MLSLRPSQETGAVLAAAVTPTARVPIGGKLVVVHHLFPHLNGALCEEDDLAVVGIDIHHFRVRVRLCAGAPEQTKRATEQQSCVSRETSTKQ